MPQQQLRQILKLHNGEIGSQRSLLALLTHHPNTHIRRLYHTHIVAPIANPQHNLIGVDLHSLSNDGLLSWGDSAADHCRSVTGDSVEELFLVDEGGVDADAVDYQYGVHFHGELVQFVLDVVGL
jgi:hypothetical protein